MSWQRSEATFVAERPPTEEEASGLEPECTILELRLDDGQSIEVVLPLIRGDDLRQGLTSVGDEPDQRHASSASSVRTAEQTLRWQPTMLGRIAGWLLAAGFVYLTVLTVVEIGLADQDPTLGGAIALGILFLAVAVVSVTAVMRTELRADPSGITIMNVGRTVHVAWSDFAGAEAGYHGIAIRRHSGNVVVARVAAKSNWASWTKLRTRADEIAEALSEFGRHHASNLPPRPWSA